MSEIEISTVMIIFRADKQNDIYMIICRVAWFYKLINLRITESKGLDIFYKDILGNKV